MITQRQLVVLAAVALGAVDMTLPQNTASALQRLIETSERRLALAKRVPLAKWDSHTQVQDPAREAQVIRSAVNDGAAKGLDRTFVASFFAAQIEANKLIQYSLLGGRSRKGEAPAHKPVDLAAIRHELDRTQGVPIQEPSDTAAVRGAPTCQADIAKAADRYLPRNRNLNQRLLSIALDRARSGVRFSVIREQPIHGSRKNRSTTGNLDTNYSHFLALMVV